MNANPPAPDSTPKLPPLPHVTTLRERFQNHPGGRACLAMMQGMNEPELWNRPVTGCLLYEANFYKELGNIFSLAIVDLATEQDVFYWQDSRFKNWDYSTFGRNWCEAILSFDPAWSAHWGFLLSRHPWTWSDKAIVPILTRLAQYNLSKPVSRFSLHNMDLDGSLVPDMPGWKAWNRWRKTQVEETRRQLDDLTLQLVSEGRFPSDLTAEAL